MPGRPRNYLQDRCVAQTASSSLLGTDSAFVRKQFQSCPGRNIPAPGGQVIHSVCEVSSAAEKLPAILNLTQSHKP